MDLAASLPRPSERLDMRYQWIKRLRADALVDSDEVMAPFARDLLDALAGVLPARGGAGAGRC